MAGGGEEGFEDFGEGCYGCGERGRGCICLSRVACVGVGGGRSVRVVAEGVEEVLEVRGCEELAAGAVAGTRLCHGMLDAEDRILCGAGRVQEVQERVGWLLM